MAKKKAAAVPKKPMKASSKPPKNEAKPLVEDKPKVHDRKAKPSEKNLIERGRKLAANYLVHRDGMDEDTATMVIDSMDPVDVNALITEANSSVMSDMAVAKGEDIEPAVPNFLTVPVLAEFESEEKLSFSELVIIAAEAATRKNEAEKEYKGTKVIIIGLLKANKIKKVECLGYKLDRYTGHTPRQLDEVKLLELGVSPDIIVKCWKSTEYEDVRITPPKEDK